MGRIMGKVLPEIDDSLAAWIAEQKLFFTATAPLAEDGKINCSPKGMDSFRVLDPHTVAYLDLTGSGAETIAHLRENGRIVIMFCAFDGAAKIVRLHGRGEVLEAGSSAYGELAGRFPELPGARSIIRVTVKRVSDSCGYGVPVYRYEQDRDTMVKWADRKGPDGIREYQEKNNTRSIDGLPALERP